MMKLNKKIICLLLSASLAFTGCSSTTERFEEAFSDTYQNTYNVQADTTLVASAMGRYVEELVYPAGDERFWHANKICKYDDTHVRVAQWEGYLYDSDDGGQNWDSYYLHSLEKIWVDVWTGYNLIMALNPVDRSIFVYYWVESNEFFDGAEYDDDARVYRRCFYQIRNENGTVRDLNIEIPKDLFLSKAYFDNAGTLFYVVDDSLYKYDFTKNKAEVVLCVDNLSDYSTEVMSQNGKYLITDQNSVRLYDDNKNVMEHDKVLEDFILKYYESYPLDNSLSYNNVTFKMFDDKTVYIACKTGMYRYVIGSDIVEKIMDGNLSFLGDPSMFVTDFCFLNEREIIICYSNGSIMKYTYEADIPSIPTDVIKIYAAQDIDIIKNFAYQYMERHPETYVQIETAEKFGSVEAFEKNLLQSLQTKDTSAPDLILLDGMHMANYREYLADASHILSEDIYQNVVLGLNSDNTVRYVPLGFEIPFISGKKSIIAASGSMDEFTDYMVKYRRENPGIDMIGMTGYDTITKAFLPVYGDFYDFTTDTISQSGLENYFENCRKLCLVQNDTLKARVDDFGLSYSMEDFIDGMPLIATNRFDYYYEMSMQLYRNEASFMRMNVREGMEYLYLQGLLQETGNKSMDMKICGLGEKNFYVPTMIMGITEQSTRKEKAMNFLKEAITFERPIESGYSIDRGTFAQENENQYYNTDDYIPHISITDEKGKEYTYGFRWLSQQEKEKLSNLADSLNVPIYYNKILNELIEKEVMNELDSYNLEDIDTKTMADKIILAYTN